MATKIKLMRLGKMRAPYYRIVVADARTKRDGRSIETIGKYHPKEEPSFIEVDSERAQYWLGVGAQPTEAVAAIAESNHDELGLVWPREVAPADVHIVATGKDAAIFEAAEALAGELVAAGLTVLYDDRPKVSPGVKFKDAELLGMPTIVTVGRGLADGVIELRDRATDAREEVPVADAASRVLAAVRG